MTFLSLISRSSIVRVWTLRSSRPFFNGLNSVYKAHFSIMPPKGGSSAKRKASDDAHSEDDVDARNARTKKTKSTSSAGASSKSKSKAAKSSAGDGEEGGKAETGLAQNGQPTNKVLPSEISFPSKPEGTVRIASWNVSGLAACRKKVRLVLRPCGARFEGVGFITQNFKSYVEAEDADIMILTETKVSLSHHYCPP